MRRFHHWVPQLNRVCAQFDHWLRFVNWLDLLLCVSRSVVRRSNWKLEGSLPAFFFDSGAVRGSFLQGCWGVLAISRPEMATEFYMTKCFSFFLGAFVKLRKQLLASKYMSVRPSTWNHSIPTGRIFIKFGICSFFLENLSRKFNFHSIPTRAKGIIIHENLRTSDIVSCWIIFVMRDTLGRSCREVLNTYFNINLYIFRRSWPLRDNVEKYGTAGQVVEEKIIWRMRFYCWITKATDTYSEYVIIIFLPLQQFWR